MPATVEADQCLVWRRDLGLRAAPPRRLVRGLRARVQEIMTERVEWHCVVIA